MSSIRRTGAERKSDPVPREETGRKPVPAAGQEAAGRPLEMGARTEMQRSLPLQLFEYGAPAETRMRSSAEDKAQDAKLLAEFHLRLMHRVQPSGGTEARRFEAAVQASMARHRVSREMAQSLCRTDAATQVLEEMEESHGYEAAEGDALRRLRESVLTGHARTLPPMSTEDKGDLDRVMAQLDGAIAGQADAGGRRDAAESQLVGFRREFEAKPSIAGRELTSQLTTHIVNHLYARRVPVPADVAAQHDVLRGEFQERMRLAYREVLLQCENHPGVAVPLQAPGELCHLVLHAMRRDMQASGGAFGLLPAMARLEAEVLSNVQGFRCAEPHAAVGAIYKRTYAEARQRKDAMIQEELQSSPHAPIEDVRAVCSWKVRVHAFSALIDEVHGRAPHDAGVAAALLRAHGTLFQKLDWGPQEPSPATAYARSSFMYMAMRIQAMEDDAAHPSARELPDSERTRQVHGELRLRFADNPQQLAALEEAMAAFKAAIGERTTAPAA